VEAVKKDAVVDHLVLAGWCRDRACQYADAFLEYSVAMANIDANGVIVGHPRTGSPIENPYLSVRDRALKKLQAFESGDDVAELWGAVPAEKPKSRRGGR
jgi:hypothetical protein